jgi:hypothetical protein
MAKVTMRRGKFGGINVVANKSGLVVALAIDLLYLGIGDGNLTAAQITWNCWIPIQQT